MKIKSAISVFKNTGFRGIINVLRFKLSPTYRENNTPRKIDISKTPQMPSFEDILKIDLIKNPYKKPNKINKEKLKLAWISPPIGPGGGGHANIVRFMKYMQDSGHEVNFSIYSVNSIPQTNKEAENVLNKFYGIDIEVKDASDLRNHDVIFATSWETAYCLYNLKTSAHKMYFVQDFEPYFFGVGSRYKLAEATYRFGFYGITAGKWLTKKVGKYGMKADYYDFGVNLDLYKPKSKEGFKKKKQILFYARPSTERRGFELGVMALDIFKQKHPEYEIIMVGQDVSNYKIPFKYKNLGVLRQEDLPKIYSESVACLVMSLTNVSLLPLELLAAGCVPVMNDGENNTMVLGETEGILYSDILPLNLAEKLCKSVENPDIEKNAEEISRKVLDRSWEKSLKKFSNIIMKEIKK